MKSQTVPGVQEDAERLAALALIEDGPRDLTTEVAITRPIEAAAGIEFRTPGVLAGTVYAEAVAAACEIGIRWDLGEGSRIDRRAIAGSLTGDLARMLRAERPLLNLLQRASGIATMTRNFVDAVAGTSCRVLHTRKTAPGLRIFDLNAVLAGGGVLHRIDLAATVMFKDNHWAALAREGRTLTEAVRSARSRKAAAVYVEVESLEQLRQAVAAGADRLLIDNQTPEMVGQWTRSARDGKPGIEIEATGGITLENARAYALAGADFISIGALTHSVVAADISLEINS
ncbi:MAG: carboxylating nicotinate-nucleotide diphosphorylase [Gemmatimonadota bacterium]